MPGIAVKQFWMKKTWISKAKAVLKHVGKLFRHRRVELHRSLPVRGTLTAPIEMKLNILGRLTASFTNVINLKGSLFNKMSESINLKGKIENWKIEMMKFLEE